MSLDYVVVRSCRRGGYELRDEYGDYVGCAPTLANARRVAEAAGASLLIEAEVPETDSSRLAAPLPRQAAGPIFSTAVPASEPALRYTGP